MVSRRKWIIGLASTVAISGGVYTTNTSVQESVSGAVKSAAKSTSNVGTPTTESKIGVVHADTLPEINDEGEVEQVPEGLIIRLEFYESGAAIVYPKASHGCFDGFALVHQATSLDIGSDGTTDTSDALGTWEFGEFDEPITIDLASAISQKDNYPSNDFKFVSISTDGACIASDPKFHFQVPKQLT